ncbi:hypothetical protein [Bradymonas sediminis]|uniref:hypothetical protein n=1 Tax=Bradymonas sediminis TaxID=1548548 RepID=UPI00105D47ED|nr:hypothetical protein [Bradymonas sediminis]
MLNCVASGSNSRDFLGGFLLDVDPHGRVVPNELKYQISQAVSVDSALQLARLSSGFAIGTSAWRTIARPALEWASKSESDECDAFYYALRDRSTGSWFGTLGEVPVVIIEAMESARHQLKEEKEDVFLPFWEWQVGVAERAFYREEQRAKEERGE